MVYTINAIERLAHFLSENRTEPYKKYRSGVSQLKNALGANNGLRSQALPGLERRGA